MKAIDQCVATLHRGESKNITCNSADAYGEQGFPPRVPPNANLTYDIMLLDWRQTVSLMHQRIRCNMLILLLRHQPTQPWDATPAQRVQAAQRVKDQGAELFKVHNMLGRLHDSDVFRAVNGKRLWLNSIV